MKRFWCFFIIFSSQISLGQQPTPEYILGVTSGPLPYLEYGFGSDRLGAAKITFLDSGVLVKVVDSTIINYKVQLSKNHFAYLQKSNFTRDKKLRLRSYYLTNSFIVNGDEKYDYVSIALNERLPYKSMQLINPSKLVIDVYGAITNTNWITQRSTAKEVKNVYHEQVEDDVFRVTIELKHDQHWGYTIYYDNNNLTVKIKRQPEELELHNLKIAIDAGHGGTNKGAMGETSGIWEKDYTLKIAKELEEDLQAEGATVFMTRTIDTTLDMIERIKMVEKEDPDFLISIHLNSAGRESASGVSTYYRYIGFRPLTKHVLNSMLELGLEEFGNVGSFNFALSGPTDYPNCLVEVAFLSNREDEKKILNPVFHRAVATKITEGIKSWLKECEKSAILGSE